jgi:hypothetical protein
LKEGRMPFTVGEFLGVFKSYNNSVWPSQIILFISALYIVFLIIKKRKYSDRLITFILMFYWLWIGIVYHLYFFTRINPAAYIFGIIFIIQAVLFYTAGIYGKKLIFEWHSNLNGFIGAFIILYALIIYPLLGMYFGHVYPENPTFGLPCPTTIFTLGILIWIKGKIPLYIIVIPLLWSVLGFSAAVNLGIKEDTGLIISGIISAVVFIKVQLQARMIKAA